MCQRAKLCRLSIKGNTIIFIIKCRKLHIGSHASGPKGIIESSRSIYPRVCILNPCSMVVENIQIVVNIQKSTRFALSC